MSYRIDLAELAQRESEQTEWKESVADVDDVVATLSAFANDLQNLGGGYVVCGAKEDRDPDGFPRLVRTGLGANRLKEIENVVLTRCRERVSPPITPLVEELPADDTSRRILVFVQPATSTAHSFRRGNDGAKYYVRVSRSTIEARNGILRDLLVRKGAQEPWDRRPCNGATESDLDLVVLRDALQRMGVFSPERGIESYLSPDAQLSPLAPSLCVREPLTGVLRPRNFAILLFGRETQRFIPGAVSFFSLYPGVDRSDRHAGRQELAGNLLMQTRRLLDLLEEQSYTVFDKGDPAAPNVLTYPERALREAMINALVHRDYELLDPTRVTVFADRIEILSPGALPQGITIEAVREGDSWPKWRNQALAWFFMRLQLAETEGQGIPTILREMSGDGRPAPTFDADDTRVVWILPAHPRHAVLRDLRLAEQSIASLGQVRGDTLHERIESVEVPRIETIKDVVQKLMHTDARYPAVVVLSGHKSGRATFTRQLRAYLQATQPAWEIVAFSTRPLANESVPEYLARMRSHLRLDQDADRLVACISGWSWEHRKRTDPVDERVQTFAHELGTYLEDPAARRPFSLVAIGGYGLYLLRNATHALSAVNTVAQVELPDLTEDEIHGLMQDIDGGRFSRQDAAEVWLRSGGHPFLAKRLLHAWCDEPAAGWDGAARTLEDDEDYLLPTFRIAARDPDVRHALRRCLDTPDGIRHSRIDPRSAGNYLLYTGLLRRTGKLLVFRCAAVRALVEQCIEDDPAWGATV